MSLQKLGTTAAVSGGLSPPPQARQFAPLNIEHLTLFNVIN